MTIPIEVVYHTVGKRHKNTRNVIGIICPTVLAQEMRLRKVEPIIVEMGDVQVDWQATSPGYENLREEQKWINT